jgi:hypothetical protein
MNKFCPLPWQGLHISPQGNYKPCCKSLFSYGNSLEEYQTNDKLLELRQNILKGNQPSNCNLCWSEESANALSLRQYYTQFVSLNDFENLDGLKVLHLAFGNICNLACRTCSSYSSSKWITDEGKLGVKKFDFKKFYTDKVFLDNIKNISQNLLQVTFSGGEVFYSGVNEHLDYLDFLIGKNSEEITLQYITNTTKFPTEEFWTRWKKFKKVQIELSIDGIESHFEYIRYPANWQTCYNNIKKYQLNKEIDISISHTVSFFNVFYLDKFYLWCLKEKLPLPYVNLVHYPFEFNIKYLPPRVKVKLKEKLINYKIFNPVVNFLEVDAVYNENSVKIDTILEKIYSLDTIRNQNFHAVFPEFSKLLNE